MISTSLIIGSARAAKLGSKQGIFMPILGVVPETGLRCERRPVFGNFETSEVATIWHWWKDKFGYKLLKYPNIVLVTLSFNKYLASSGISQYGAGAIVSLNYDCTGAGRSESLISIPYFMRFCISITFERARVGDKTVRSGDLIALSSIFYN